MKFPRTESFFLGSPCIIYIILYISIFFAILCTFLRRGLPAGMSKNRPHATPQAENANKNVKKTVPLKTPSWLDISPVSGYNRIELSEMLDDGEDVFQPFMKQVFRLREKQII